LIEYDAVTCDTTPSGEVSQICMSLPSEVSIWKEYVQSRFDPSPENKSFTFKVLNI
jgi:hypothetical protein